MGIPSHESYDRVYACLEEEEFQTGFVGWMNASYCD